MGSWGITMRESDYGLDLLATIVATQLKVADFSTFNVTDALEVIKCGHYGGNQKGQSRQLCGGIGFLF